MNANVHTAMSDWFQKGIVPTFKLSCYTVSTSSSGYRTFTRYYAGDLTADYIDRDSIRWEASRGTSFEPGGIVPSRLSVRILPGCGGLTGIVATQRPTTFGQYDRAYEIILQWQDEQSIYSTSIGGMYIVTSKSPTENGDAVSLEFLDELTVLDGFEYDLADMPTSDYRTIVRNLFMTNGVPIADIVGVDDYIIAGNNYYRGNQMTARQALSRILQMNGCYMLQLGQQFVIRPLNHTYGSADVQMDREYSQDYSFDEYEGEWTSAIINPPDDPIQYSGNSPTSYILKDNPLLSEGNKNTYATTLQNRITNVSRHGFSIKYLCCPEIEVGDIVQMRFKMRPNVYTSKKMAVARITWDGGAYFTLSEDLFDPMGRTA